MTLPRLTAVATWTLAALVVAVNAPAVFCLGMGPDPVQFDLIARNIMDGGVPYRDICENNLPGMTWLHLVARSLFGWSFEALRAIDLVVMTTVIVLLAAWLPGMSLAARGLVVALLSSFYLSTSEWCHCERDPWMLLPALATLWMRHVQVQRFGRQDRRPVFAFAMLEGLLWGAVVWIKPYILVPAMAAWLWSVREAFRGGGLRLVIADSAGVLLGGIAAGASGIAWLHGTGAWPWFAETVLEWNRDYIATDVYEGAPGWMIWLNFGLRNWPWSIAYLVAVPYAIAMLGRRQADSSRTLLAVFFLGWLLQAAVLQHCFDYVHTPALLLALVLVADLPLHLTRPYSVIVVGLVAGLAIWGHAPVAVQRTTILPRCLFEGSTPELRDRLSRLGRPGHWRELERVACFLEASPVNHGELTCLDMSTAPLYLRLNLKPSMRYTLLLNSLYCFRNHREAIKDAVAASATRVLVCDFTTLHGHPRNIAPNAGEPSLPPLPERWKPWKKHVVFRSGRFLVLQLNGEETRRWLTEVLGL